MQPPIKRDSHPTASEATTPLQDIRKTLPLRVLSQADWLHWTTRGYVIVRQAVPAATVERLVDVLWQFDEKDPDDSDARVRMAQYISMHPADWNNAPERAERIRLWRELDSPKRDAFPGDPRHWEQQHARTATLTPLGERLLGLISW